MFQKQTAKVAIANPQASREIVNAACIERTFGNFPQRTRHRGR